MFYGIYYYYPNGGRADVKLVGFYDDLEKAKTALNQVIPNYKPYTYNSVRGNDKVGWINAYEMNQPLNNPTDLSCWQPHTSVNLFTS